MSDAQEPSASPPVLEPNLAGMRVDYRLGRLDEESIKPDPFDQFEVWFRQACEAGLLEPNAMTLATVGPDLKPTTRTVLLKHWDRRGFVFFTNLESRKAAQIAANPNVSLLFAWLPLQRQVSINGVATRVSTAEVLAYFVKRPFASQLAAWASPQSRVISTRSILEMKWQEMKTKFREGEVPLPSFWGGFRVVPREIEFWQGGESRLHDRFMFSRESESAPWKRERWAP
jgi:pyridoxamine 5'-phosphate oxidase